MIAKSSWFSPRKYSGWGLTPNSWQGWLYLGVIALPLILINVLQLNSPGWTWFLYIWGGVFALDFIDLMIHVKRDERDVIHEAIAERNAMWFMVAALGAGIAYQVAVGIIHQTNQVDPVIIIALFGSLIVKAISNFYLKDK